MVDTSHRYRVTMRSVSLTPDGRGTMTSELVDFIAEGDLAAHAALYQSAWQFYDVAADPEPVEGDYLPVLDAAPAEVLAANPHVVAEFGAAATEVPAETAPEQPQAPAGADESPEVAPEATEPVPTPEPAAEPAPEPVAEQPAEPVAEQPTEQAVPTSDSDAALDAALTGTATVEPAGEPAPAPTGKHVADPRFAPDPADTTSPAVTSPDPAAPAA